MSNWTADDYLMHHGIKGQKWGVRRFQNPDGTLTAAGQKRYNVLQAASKSAERKAKAASTNADDYEKDAKEYEKKYGGDKGAERWLNETFGRGWRKDKDLHEMAEGDDEKILEMARNTIKDEIKDNFGEAKRMADIYRSEAKKWTDLAKKYGNTPIVDVSRKELKSAKKLAKEYGLL